MIKFLRRIRQKSLTENKFSKYLLYAIGEILLVVIGILIALQLNNLNDNSKNKQLENKYLFGILENLNEDIGELDILHKKDIEKLNNYTILIKAFSDKNIRSDMGLLKTAVQETNGTHSFNGNRIIFDDMKFSGKMNLIQSDNLRKNIMAYYNTVDNLLEASDKINNRLLEVYDREISKKSGIGTLVGYRAKDKWKSSTYDFDDSFFDKDIKEDQVKEFSQNLEWMKMLILRIGFHRSTIIEQANQLKNQINKYLGIEIETTPKDESNSSVEKDDFIPSSPENLFPITKEELSAYEGNYQIVNSTNDAYTDLFALVKIYREGNHLIIENIFLNSYSSFYSTVKDEFIYAYSFLFDDEISQASIQFGRDNNQQVNQLILKGWDGIYEYKKIK